MTNQQVAAMLNKKGFTPVSFDEWLTNRKPQTYYRYNGDLGIDIDGNVTGRFFIIQRAKHARIFGKYGYCHNGESTSTDSEMIFMQHLNNALQ